MLQEHVIKLKRTNVEMEFIIEELEQGSRRV